MTIVVEGLTGAMNGIMSAMKKTIRSERPPKVGVVSILVLLVISSPVLMLKNPVADALAYSSGTGTTSNHGLTSPIPEVLSQSQSSLPTSAPPVTPSMAGQPFYASLNLQTMDKRLSAHPLISENYERLSSSSSPTPTISDVSPPSKGMSVPQRDLDLLKPLPPSQVTKPVTPPSKESLMSGAVVFPPTPGNVQKNENMQSTSQPSKNFSAAGAGVPGTDRRVSIVPGTSPQNEPTISARVTSVPKANTYLVAGANDYRSGDSQCGIYRSIDGGTTWQDRGVLPGPFTAGDGTPLTVGADPVIRHAAGGGSGGSSVFYSCLAFNRGNPNTLGSIFVSRSDDNGATWNAPVAVRKSSGPNEFNDKQWIAVDTYTDSPFRDNVYVCWSQFDASGGATINFARSTNRGDSFSSQKILDATRPNQGCTAEVGPNGGIYVAWQDFSTNPSRLLVRKSVDGGVSFGPAVKVNDIITIQSPLPNNGFRVNSFPSMATARNGDIHIVWADDRFRASGFGADILIATSTNGGSTWTTRNVNLVDSSATDQFFPTIDVGYLPSGAGTGASNVGTIHVYYYDKRYVTSPANTFLDITEAHSHNRATDTFTLTRVTGVPFNPNLAACTGFFSGLFIGDYIDVNSMRKTNAGVWTDCRNAPTTGQDIFTDNVSPV